MGGSYQQEIDLLTLFKDVAGEYVQMVTVPEQLPNVLDRAIRVAAGRRAPTAVIIPSDVQELEYSAADARVQDGALEPGDRLADADAGRRRRRRAAELLNAGRRWRSSPAPGPVAPAAELEQVADLLGAGVAKALLGKDVLPDDLPYVTGSIGLLGTRPSYEMMMGCDTLLTVGSSFPYTQFMPAFDQAKAVQIDLDPTMIGMRYPYQVNLVGDAATTLRALIPQLRRKTDRRWRESIEDDVARWWETMRHAGAARRRPGEPDAAVRRAVAAPARRRDRHRRLRLVGELVRPPAVLPRRTCAARCRATSPPWAPGCPTGSAPSSRHPDRPVVVFAGDGAMQMNGLAELITI